MHNIISQAVGALTAGAVLFVPTLVSDGQLGRGTCAGFSNGVIVCVPQGGPGNTRRSGPIFEDGSAVYGPKHNRWVYDPESATFRR